MGFVSIGAHHLNVAKFRVLTVASGVNIRRVWSHVTSPLWSNSVLEGRWKTIVIQRLGPASRFRESCSNSDRIRVQDFGLSGLFDELCYTGASDYSIAYELRIGAATKIRKAPYKQHIDFSWGPWREVSGVGMTRIELGNA